MKISDFTKLIKNKIGEIYVARKGSVTAFIVEGNTYLVSNLGNYAVIVNPHPNYWTHSIDWAGGFCDYFTHQMCPPDKLTFKVKPIVKIKVEYLAKLKNLVKLRSKYHVV